MIRDRHVDERCFGPEVAADVYDMNFDFFLRKAEGFRHLLAQPPRSFVRSPHIDSSIAVRLYGASAWLEVTVVRQRRAESVFENARGLLQCAFSIAVLPEDKRLEIMRRHTFRQFRRVFVFASIFMDERDRKSVV